MSLDDGSRISASAVVLAVGHSARPLYRVLQREGVAMTAKPFAMGFRIEHPQVGFGGLRVVEGGREGGREGGGTGGRRGKVIDAFSLPGRPFYLPCMSVSSVFEPAGAD